MNLMRARTSALLSLISTLFLIGFLAQANSKNSFEKTQIHGFDVYLVNVPGATQAYFTAVVPTGSSYDDPVIHAGRAHLWEHVIHRGNQKYPKGLLNDGTMESLAANYNASTGGNQVFYYATVPSKNLEKFIEIVGAQTTLPLISESDFISEKQVVKNEAKSYQNQDGRALTNIMNIYLREQGHPLAMYSVGTQAQLDAMTTDDMKDLFYRDYRPGNLFLIVAGDFQNQINQHNVLTAIEKYFVPPDVPSPFSGREPTSKKIFPTPDFHRQKINSSPTVIELESKEGHRILLLTFDANATYFRQHPEAKDVLLSYFRSHNTGSLAKGFLDQHWIQDWNVSDIVLNNRHHFEFEMNLTQEGYSHRFDIVEKILAQGGELSRRHLNAELVDYIRVKLAQSKTQFTNGNVSAAARTLQQKLVDNIAAEKISSTFQFQENYEKVTAEKIRQAAQHLFLAPHLMVGIVAPEVNNIQGLSMDPIFQRKYRTLQDPIYRQRWEDALQSGALQQPKIPLEFEIAKVPGVVRSQKQISELKLHADSHTPTGVLSEEVKVQQDRALVEKAKKIGLDSLVLSMNFRKLNTQERLTLEASLSAFFHENLGFWDYLSYAGVSLQPETHRNGFTISSMGEQKSSFAAITWFLDRWKNFQPTSQQILTGFEEIRSEELHSAGQFSAMLAYKKSSSILEIGTQDKMKVLAALKKKEIENPGFIRQMMEPIFRRVDISAGLAGSWSKEQAVQLLQMTRQHWPDHLTDKEREILRLSTFPLVKTTELHTVLPGNRDQEEFSQARVWHLSDLNVQKNIKDSNSSRILENMLSTMAFQINRTEKGLGYVHGASRMVPDSSPYIVLYGQTSKSQDRSLSIAQGWNEILEKIIQHDPFALKVFEDSKKGLLHAFEKIPSVRDQAFLLWYLASENLQKNFRAEVIQQLPQIQYEDIAQLVQRYMSKDNPYLDVKMHEKIGQSTAKQKQKEAQKDPMEGTAASCTNIFFNVKSARHWMQGK